MINADILLRAYAAGIFPMAESAASDELLWFDPPVRAIIPLDDSFHVPRRLLRAIKRRPYEVRLDTAFEKVMRACAEPTPDRPTTWINQEIIALYRDLHEHGHAHSVEIWRDDALIGGLYGVSIGSAFFGESMFSRSSDASKIALVHLVALLRNCGFILLDTQFKTEHLAQFGTIEITRAAYRKRLAKALEQPAVLRLNDGEWADHLAAGIDGGAGEASAQPVTHKS